MIDLIDLRKSYVANGLKKTVANGLNVRFPAKRSFALLGSNGAGKSTLLRMIAGAERPDSGEIRINGSVSWPVGFAGSFHPDLSGEQNAKFVARIYGVDTDELVEFVREFAGLGGHYYLPFGSYSSGMRSRLAFGVSMAIPFDMYLVDEVTSVGDALFKDKSQKLFTERRKHAGAIVVSHSMGMIREMCECGGVLYNGNLYTFGDVNEAIYFHRAVIKYHKKNQ